MEFEGSYCGDDIDFAIMCFCGERAPLCKSKSNANPGRRFFGCSNYMNEEHCGFFCWYDPSPNLTKKGVVRPMKIWNVKEVGKASEQVESSWTPLKKIDEIHSERSAMQMKIDVMEAEIENLNVMHLLPFLTIAFSFPLFSHLPHPFVLAGNGSFKLTWLEE